jgi:hypothetical protein
VLFNARLEPPAHADEAQPMVVDAHVEQQAEEEGEEGDDGQPSGGKWACTACTFHNARGSRECEMCGSAAPAEVAAAATAAAAGGGPPPPPPTAIMVEGELVEESVKLLESLGRLHAELLSMHLPAAAVPSLLRFAVRAQPPAAPADIRRSAVRAAASVCRHAAAVRLTVPSLAAAAVQTDILSLLACGDQPTAELLLRCLYTAIMSQRRPDRSPTSASGASGGGGAGAAGGFRSTFSFGSALQLDNPRASSPSGGGQVLRGGRGGGASASSSGAAAAAAAGGRGGGGAAAAAAPSDSAAALAALEAADDVAIGELVSGELGDVLLMLLRGDSADPAVGVHREVIRLVSCVCVCVCVRVYRQSLSFCSASLSRQCTTRLHSASCTTAVGLRGRTVSWHDWLV